MLVQTIRAEGQAPPSHADVPPLEAEFDDVTELFVGHLMVPGRGLLVREGDRVQRGQLLARLTWQDPD